MESLADPHAGSMDAVTMQSSIQRRVTETVEPSAVRINSVKLTLATDPDTGKLIERRLYIDLSHDEDAINAVESSLIEQLRGDAGE